MADGVAAGVLVHIAPLLLLEDGGHLAELRDQTEDIVIHFIEDVVDLAFSLLSAEPDDDLDGVAEVAVFFVFKEQVDCCVAGLASLIEADAHDVIGDLRAEGCE